MRIRILLFPMFALCLAACGAESGQGSGGTKAPDLSTPRGAIEAMMAASAAKDLDGVAASFATTCEKEFKPLVDKTAKPKMLEEWWKLFGTATIDGVDAPGDDKATVHVTMGTGRKEHIEMVREGGAWKIQGF